MRSCDKARKLSRCVRARGWHGKSALFLLLHANARLKIAKRLNSTSCMCLWHLRREKNERRNSTQPTIKFIRQISRACYRWFKTPVVENTACYIFQDTLNRRFFRKHLQLFYYLSKKLTFCRPGKHELQPAPLKFVWAFLKLIFTRRPAVKLSFYYLLVSVFNQGESRIEMLSLINQRCFIFFRQVEITQRIYSRQNISMPQNN